MSTNKERDTHFQEAARLFMNALFTAPLPKGYRSVWETHQLIARFLYDFAESGCQAIHDQQMKQGVRLHPRAMLRAILDMTEWPASSDADDESEE